MPTEWQSCIFHIVPSARGQGLGRPDDSPISQGFSHLLTMNAMVSDLFQKAASSIGTAKFGGEVDHNFELNGSIDIINNQRVAGWVWDKTKLADRLNVVIRQAQLELLTIEACAHRPDLQHAGIGDGYYSFDVRLDRTLSDDDLRSVSVEVYGRGYLIPIAAGAIQPDPRDCQLNVYNFDKLRTQPPSKFGVIRFDPNNDCNLRCVYCHNHRSNDVIDTENFRAFLHQNVVSTFDFQVGCIMEPTLDSRLPDLMLMIAASPARPNGKFVLQTNGLLLHRHDHEKMATAGLNQLQVSLDTADPGTQRSLRSGMSLQKVLRNIAGFREACPEIDVLLLNHGDFTTMKQVIVESFGSRANLVFADEKFLQNSTQKMLSDSG